MPRPTLRTTVVNWPSLVGKSRISGSGIGNGPSGLQIRAAIVADPAVFCVLSKCNSIQSVTLQRTSAVVFGGKKRAGYRPTFYLVPLKWTLEPCHFNLKRDFMNFSLHTTVKGCHKSKSNGLLT